MKRKRFTEEQIIAVLRSGLPELVREECRDLIDQIAQKTERIEAKTVQLKKLAAQTGTARRLQTMPGVGPLMALAIEAFGPNMASFNVAVTSQPGWAWSRGPQGARTGFEGRTSRHSPVAHHRVDVTAELARAQVDLQGILAGADAGKEATYAGGDRLWRTRWPGRFGPCSPRTRIIGIRRWP